MTDRRGKSILDMAAGLGLLVLDTGKKPTYRMEGIGESIPDVTFASDGLATRVMDWRVLDDYTASDHQYITLQIQGAVRRGCRGLCRVTGWNLNKLAGDGFLWTLRSGREFLSPVMRRLNNRVEAEALLTAVTEILR